MEQRTGASSKPSKAEPLKTEPVTGAGFDPAFIPGLTAPAKADTSTPKEAKPDPDPDPDPAPAPEKSEEAAGTATPDDITADDTTDSDAADGDGPVFEASDRRARIVADRKGVRLRLDEESCEFRWDEIAAVETESPRFGKRYTITVHTPERRWYPIEIEAASKSRFKEWDEQIDAVLDAYFEDGE